MRTRRGPRLLSRLMIAVMLGGVLASAAVVALQAHATVPACPANSQFGDLCVVSTSQWTEDPGSDAIHLVGELRNDGSQNLTGITVNLDLLNSSGNRIGPDSAASTAVVLAPGELTPFEQILQYPQPAGYNHFQVASVVAARSTSQAAHLPVTFTTAGCPKDNICGQVTNSGAATLDNPRAVFTFYDGSGKTVAQDVTTVANASTGAFVLAHNDTGTFTEDPTWFQSWVSFASYAVLTDLASPVDYPVDLNPAPLTFPGQVVGTTSPADHVTLTNNGPRALAVGGGIATTGDFSQANNCGSSVASHSSCVIDISFAPTAHGVRGGTLSITDDGAGTPQSILLSGTGTMPVATLNPTALTFASLSKGSTSAPQTVTLKNTGDGAMTITSITVDPNFSQSNACPGVLAVGASCDITVRFTPGQVGNLSGSLTIKDNAAGSPQSVSLSGTAVGAGVQLTPSSLDFGTELVGTTSSAKPITLRNSGNDILTIGTIATTGDFTQTNDCPPSLNAGQACTISVRFTPTAPGSRSGSVNLSDNAGSQSATLTGTGAGRPATALHASSTQQYTLSNSDGSTWKLIDTAGKLQLTIPSSTAPGTALLSGNADLWTQNAGINQDLGIFVNGNDGTGDQLVAWKESGGSAGTFSPNAAFVQTSLTLVPGKTYTVTLMWKTNKPTGGTIRAGAGLDPNFSPTTLAAEVLPTGIISSPARSNTP